MPAPLAAVLEKAVAIQRYQRHDSAAAFARDLRCWLRGEPVEAVPAGRWRRLIKRVERHPIAATVAVCAVVAVATLGATVLSTFIYMQWWWWQNQTPAKVVHDKDGKGVSVIARSGRTVASIPIKVGSVRQAELLGQPDTGGAPMVVVALSQDDVASEIDVLRLYNARTGGDLGGWRPMPPEWWVPRGPNDPAYGPYFRCCRFQVMDIFPGHPGKEIVAVYHHNRSSITAITVHDLKGKVLFSVWHDGFLYDFARIGDTDTIVLTGVNSDGEWND